MAHIQPHIFHDEGNAGERAPRYEMVEVDGYDVLYIYDGDELVISVIIGQVIHRGSTDPLKYNMTGAYEDAEQQWETYIRLTFEEAATKDSALAAYGPAYLVSDVDWENYLLSLGILPEDFTSKYDATLQELETAWGFGHPDESFAGYVAQQWGGTIPSWFAQEWGISTPEAISEGVAAPLTPGQGRRGRPTPTVPWQGPPTPAFLEELTGLEAGQPLEARPTRFASGQLLQQLTPSQLQGIGGYVNWAAGQVSGAPASFEDWLYGSQQLLPQPRRGVRWSPSPYSV